MDDLINTFTKTFVAFQSNGIEIHIIKNHKIAAFGFFQRKCNLSVQEVT